jgi:nucleotide-binding universal stress UspA family protein
MLPLKRILCPTDFSADSRAAMRVANEMALYFSAELTLVHVIPAPLPAVWPYEGFGINPVNVGGDPEDTLKACRRMLEDDAREFVSADADVRLEVVEGEPAGEILDLAAGTKADIIVLATHGHNRLRKALFGSTAEKVVKDSPCPVITLHAGQEAAGLAESSPTRKAEV